MPVTQALPQQGSYDNSAAATIAAKGGDELLMGEFGNADDQESNW